MTLFRIIIAACTLLALSCTEKDEEADQSLTQEDAALDPAPEPEELAAEGAQEVPQAEAPVLPTPVAVVSDSKGEAPASQTFSAISLTQPADGSYAAGSVLVFQLDLGEAFEVQGSPSLTLQLGSGIVSAPLTTAGQRTLEFAYTVRDGDMDPDGIEILGLNLAEGTVTRSDQSQLAADISSLLSPSTGVLVDTSAAAPNQVVGLAIAPTTSQDSLAATWTVPSGNGTAVSSYLIQYRPAGSELWQSRSSATNALTLDSLEAGQAYQIRVAGNNGRLGAFSEIITATTFDVSQLNPIAWLDATDPSGDGSQPEDGSLLATWVDKTGQASNASETEAAAQPVFQTAVQNGLPAIRFDDKDRGLQGTFSRSEGTDLSVVIVGQFDEGYTDRCLFEFRSDAGDARAFFIDRRYAANTYYNPSLSKGSFQLWVIENKGGTARVYERDTVIFDGAITFNTDFTGGGYYVLGDDTTGGNRLFGYIGEILIFDRALSADDLSSLRNYLVSKWGLN